MSARSAAVRFGIGISRAIAWIASARQGRLTPAKQGRCGGSRLDAHEDYIVGIIEEEKDITRNEMVLRLSEGGAISIGRSALYIWLQKRGLTFKKDRTCIGAGASRPSEASQKLVRRLARSRSGASRLVFIDETGLNTKMSRLRGRALCGERCRSPIPHGHWKATTFTGALRLSGIAAPMVLAVQ